jgi:DNA-binding MarR family transcriptional regulator
MEDVYAKPGYLFRRMQQIAVSIFTEECRDFDLTPVQYAALTAIGTHAGIDATRLSQVIAFDRSTLGSVIERLEAKGHVERRPREEDRRVKLLYLTAGGMALLHAVREAVERAQLRMLAPLEASERQTLMKLLVRLVDLNNEASRVPLRAEDAIEHFNRVS